MVPESKNDEKVPESKNDEKHISPSLVTLVMNGFLIGGGFIGLLLTVITELNPTITIVTFFGLAITCAAIWCMTCKTTDLYKQHPCLRKVADYMGLFCSGFSLAMVIVKLCWPIFVEMKCSASSRVCGIILGVFLLAIVVLWVLEKLSRHDAKSANTTTTESTDTTTTETTERGSAAQENVTKQE